METNEKKVFAPGLTFYKLFAIFVIGSILGVYYEQILHLVKTYIATGDIVWESRRGVIYGPFNPLYGFGLALMTYFLAHHKRPIYVTFLYAALLGGAVEYLISFLQETFIGTVSWDYSDLFLNINGRTTIPLMVFWGLSGMLLVRVVYPYISKLIEAIPYKIGKTISIVLIIFLSIDCLISWTALFRQDLRRNNIEPYTVVGELYDKYYTDEFLSKYYPNMVPKESR